MKLMYSIIIVLVAVALIFFALKKVPHKTEIKSEDSSQSVQTQQSPEPKPAVNNSPTAVTSEDLLMTTTKQGTGPEAKNGDTLSVHYTGYLSDGTKFDSSLDRGTPFEFVLGSGQVIKGWDLGMLGMKKGEVRKLIIPAKYGYGESGFPGVIPGNATLAFEVELLEIK